MRFSWIDLIVIIFVIRGMVIGHRRGLSGELLRFLGIVCAFYLSFKFYEPAADRLMRHVTLDRNVAIGLSFAGVFLAVLVFFYMLNQTVHRMMEIPAVATLEKGGGALLGGAKALLFAFALLILLALVKVESISNAVSRHSFFGPLAISAVPGAYSLAVRVYPAAQSLPAKELIQQLPPVKEGTGPPDTGERARGPKKGAEAAAAGEQGMRAQDRGGSR